MTTILVGGVIANKCLNAGAIWTRLSWVLGVRRLGFDVHFVEQIAPECCVDDAGNATSFEESANLSAFKAVTEQFDLTNAATLIYGNGDRTHGLTKLELLDLADSADLLINISGHIQWEPLFRRPSRRLYLDLDPGFTQFWHAAGDAGARLAGHDLFYTIGENIGRSGCLIPLGGVPWRTTRQPVVLDEWPAVRLAAIGPFTTVASWRGPYGPIETGGKTLGLKVHEFRKVIELPQRVPHTFELALDIHPADEKDLVSLYRYGWSVANPRVVAATPDAFRRYVQQSGAEFSVAQGVYVETESGWFSDRTTRYLASGKPALVQDTGFSRNYPVGDGLIAFRTLDEAIAGAERIIRDYLSHCRAARQIAEAYFDSNRVIGTLMEELGLTP